MYLVFPLKVELAQTPHYHYHKLIQIQDYVHLDTISKGNRRFNSSSR